MVESKKRERKEKIKPLKFIDVAKMILGIAESKEKAKDESGKSKKDT